MISCDMNYVDVWTHIIISFYKIDERESLVLTTLKSLVLNTMFYSLANWPFVWLSVQIVLNLGVWCLMEFMLFNMKNIELNWAKIISVLLKFNFFFREEKFFMGLTSDSLFIFEWGLNHVQPKALFCFVKLLQHQNWPSKLILAWDMLAFGCILDDDHFIFFSFRLKKKIFISISNSIHFSFIIIIIE